ARVLASLPTAAKDRALYAAAEAIVAHVDQILAANAEDVNAAGRADTSTAMIDRLALDPKRIDGIADGLRQVAALRDPVGEVVRDAQVPTIETGVGNCHVYVHAAADLEMAERILLNSKTRRPSVCNAAETLLVDAAIAGQAMPRLVAALQDAGVTVHVDPDDA